MTTVEDIAEALRQLDLVPVYREGEPMTVGVVHEMSYHACAFDNGQDMLTVVLLYRKGIPPENRQAELVRCNRINSSFYLGKCVLDDDGNLLMLCHVHLLHEEDLRAGIGDALRSLAAMKTMYLRMTISFKD